MFLFATSPQLSFGPWGLDLCLSGSTYFQMTHSDYYIDRFLCLSLHMSKPTQSLFSDFLSYVCHTWGQDYKGLLSMYVSVLKSQAVLRNDVTWYCLAL